MNKLLLLALTLILSACSKHLKPDNKLPGSGDYHDAILVVIDDPRSVQRRQQIPGPGYQSRLAYQHDPALSRRSAAIAERHGLTILQQWPLKSLALHCFLIERPNEQVLQALEKDQHIRWLQPFNQYQLQSANSDSKYPPAPGSMMDYFYLDPHHGEGIDIAVIDTGLDRQHPGLNQRQVSYFNFVQQPASGRASTETHGTAVTGLIAAHPAKKPDSTPNPSKIKNATLSQHRISGLAHKAQIQHLRACWSHANTGKGVCNTLTLALALDKAIELQPDIINLSLTGPADRLLNALMQRLLENHTLVIAAHDQQRPLSQRFPQPADGIVYAFAVENPHKTDFDLSSNTFPAPAHALTLAPEGQYNLVSGHSIAAPHLSALAARLMNRHPGDDRSDIIQHLKNQCSDFYQPGPKSQYSEVGAGTEIEGGDEI